MDDRPWGGPSPPAVAYVFADGRGTEEIAGQLTGFSGILQVDAMPPTRRWRAVMACDPTGFLSGACPAQFVEVYKTTQSPFAHEVIERLQACTPSRPRSAAAAPSSGSQSVAPGPHR